MRLSLLCLAAALLTLPAVAQPSIGVRVGLNVADVDFEEGTGFEEMEGLDQQPRLGLTAGVVADIPLTTWLSFRPEALYAQKGYVVDLDIMGTDPISSEPFSLQGTQRVEIDYVEAPLLLAYQIPTGSALDVSIEAGPSVAYRTRFFLDCDGDAELVAGCDFINEREDEVEDDDDDNNGFRKVDVGAALGLTVGAGPFDIGLRYTHGLTSLYNDDVGVEAQNRVFSVNATYRLSF